MDCSTEMKALVCYGNGDVRYEDVQEPSVGHGLVKIKVKACGICGSDIPRSMAEGAHSYPIILGHEFSGVVSEIGEGVRNVEVGDHIVGVPLIPCHSCPDCNNGNFSLCEHYSFIGSRQQGAFAEYVVIPAENAFKIDDSIPFETAALFEPSTVSLHALNLVDYKPGKSVLVIGGGTMGIFALQWAKILGARNVVVLGRDYNHLELSSRLGADLVLSTKDNSFMEKAMSFSEGRGYDYVFEAVGAEATIKYAFKLVAKKGRICYIGTPKKELSFSVREWETINRKEMFITGSWMSYSNPFPGEEWNMTNEHFVDGSLKFDKDIFYAKYPIQQGKEAFDNFIEAGKVKGRILITI